MLRFFVSRPSGQLSVNSLKAGPAGNTASRRRFHGPIPQNLRKELFLKAVRNLYPGLPGHRIQQSWEDRELSSVHAMRQLVRSIERSPFGSAGLAKGDGLSEEEYSEGVKRYEGAIQFVRFGLNDDEINTALEAGITPDRMHEMQSVKELAQLGFSEGYALRCVLAGLNKGKIEQLFADAKIPQDETQAYAQAYSEANLLISQDTMVRRTDKDLAPNDSGKNELYPIGRGFYNVVYNAKYKNAETGKVETRVFKPLHTFGAQGLLPEHQLGIDGSDAQFASRNMATSALADALGFDVAPKVEIGFHKVRDRREGSKLGIVMERAPGRSPGEQDKHIWTHPEVKRQLTQLQLLDHLTGQFDRHMGNYFVHAAVRVGPSGEVKPTIKVTGIDNDLCFSPDISHPNQLWDVAQHAALLPPVIDADMAAAITKLTPDGVAMALDGKLSRAEIASTLERLSALKAHVRALQGQNRVIDPKDWERDFPEMNSRNSYWAKPHWAPGD